MKTFLMCPPVYYGVDYEINPWMEKNIGTADKSLAWAQWSDLVETIQSYGADITLMSPAKGLPDMVFTANAGLVLNTIVVLSSFSKWQRAAEENHFKKWFENTKWGFNIQQMPCGVHFEGAGDCLIDSNKYAWLGHGFRTTDTAVHTIRSMIRFNKLDVDSYVLTKMEPAALYLETVQLVDPRFYHLDTCFCPLPNGYLLYYPPALDEHSQMWIKFKFGDKLIVSEDPTTFECNAVVIDNTVIANRFSSGTKKQLQQAGFNPIEVNLSEFIKAGGGAKCLTLEI